MNTIHEGRGSEFRRLISIMLHRKNVSDPAAQRGYRLVRLWRNLIRAHFDLARRIARRHQTTDNPKD